MLIARYIITHTRSLKMETYLVTIPISTDMDATQLLDILNSQISQVLVDEIESYNYEIEVDENEITVEKTDE